MERLTYLPTIRETALRERRPSVWRSLWSNADDGIDGDRLWQQRTAGQPTWRRRLGWWLRNPAHDLLWYWLGLVGLPVHVAARDAGSVFKRRASDGAERGGWNWALIRPMRADGSLGWPRPFVSYAGAWLVYAGWRPPQGAFGLKWRKNSAG